MSFEFVSYFVIRISNLVAAEGCAKLSVVDYYKTLMPGINKATDTDLKVIEKLQQLGWRRGNTLALPRLEIQFSNGGYQQGNK